MSVKTAVLPAAMPRGIRSGGGPWRAAVDRAQGRIAVAALAGAALLALSSPAGASALQSWSGALLLVGGAVIGVPHGSSDFVVAHRVMRPALGRWWLPTFLSGYLALVALAMAAWFLAPLATLMGFLALSGLHFGWSDMRAAAPGRHPALAFALRATTPVLPIFLLHPGGVAPFVAALGAVPDGAALQALQALRWPLLLPWGVALAALALPPLLDAGRSRAEARDAVELLAVALAAAALPPLLGFGLYFCLLHAPRHMADLAEDHHPTRPLAAARLAAAVVLPSALVCIAILVFAWNALAGMLDTGTLVTGSLRVIAALTVPHMALEALAAWPRPASRPGRGAVALSRPPADRRRSQDKNSPNIE